MSDDRYGNTRVAKIRAAYNDLRSALAEGDMGAAQAAFARYEQWSDYILDKRHSDRISALEARVKALTAAEALVAECDIYLKEGETPRQRMDRDHLDILALGKMLADDRKRRDEAEARVKALTEALDERQDSGRDFWMKWTQKRLETRNAMFLRDAKLALGGDMRALRTRVEMMEAEPMQIVLSAALQENTDDR